MRLQAHSHKPRARLHGKDAYYIGVELEVEAPDYAACGRGLEVLKKPSAVYAKHDGSLSEYGWEIVTHPIARSEWVPTGKFGTTGAPRPIPERLVMYPNPVKHWEKSFQRKLDAIHAAALTGNVQAVEQVKVNPNTSQHVTKAIFLYKQQVLAAMKGLPEPSKRSTATERFIDLTRGLKAMGYQSHNGGRCGLHMHICHKAFYASDIQSLHTDHFFWFSRLINGALFLRLSQRDGPSHYAMQVPVTPENFHVQSHSHSARYRAVNITNKTVEVRIFRGNLREERIRKAIEAVVAAIEFAREYAQSHPASNVNGTLDDEFITWAEGHRDEYPNLAAFMRDGPEEQD